MKTVLSVIVFIIFIMVAGGISYLIGSTTDAPFYCDWPGMAYTRGCSAWTYFGGE